MNRLAWVALITAIVVGCAVTALSLASRGAAEVRIVSVTVPGNLYSFMNQDAGYKQTYAWTQGSIEIAFNQPVLLDPGYTIHALQDGQIVSITPAPADHDDAAVSPVVYQMTGERMIISARNNYFPEGILVIRLPKALRSQKGTHLSDNVDIWLSSNIPSPIRYLKGKSELAVPVPLVSGSQAKVGYVMSDETLVQSPGSTQAVATLEPGDSFHIISEQNGWTKVALAYRTKTPTELDKGPLEQTLQSYTRQEVGYLPAESVHWLPQPNFSGTITVTRGPIVNVTTEAGVFKAAEFSEPLTRTEVDALFGETLVATLNLFGMEMYTKAVSSTGPNYPMLAPESQKWITSMSEGDHERYLQFYREYADRLEGILNEVKVGASLTEAWAAFRQTSLSRRRHLHNAWVIWARSESAMGPDSLVRRFEAVVEPEDQAEAQSMFRPVLENPESDDIYFQAMTKFLNRFSSSSAWWTAIRE